MIRNLNKSNENESTKEKDAFTLQRIQELLRAQASELADLGLDEDGRELVFTNELNQSPTNSTKVTGFLFDHVLLLAHIKQNGENEEIKVYRQPIPLALLDISKGKEDHNSHTKRQFSVMIPFIKIYNAYANKKETWPITFRHLGKIGYELTLYASSEEDQTKWLELINIAHQRLRTHAEFCNIAIISSKYFTGTNKVNCAVTFDHGNNVLYGTDNGIYISGRKNSGEAPQKVLDARKVTQIDVLEEHHLLLVLSDKMLRSYVLKNIGSLEFAISKVPKGIQSHCSFFKSGTCMQKHMVSCVKSGSISSTVKVFGFDDAAASDNAKASEPRLFKEFYVPRESFSVHFLKSKLCLACSQGFEVVSLETLETQPLVDQADTTLHKKNTKPIHIQRIDDDFLLNYTEFSIFVNRNGQRARSELRVDWAGRPQSFAVRYPWIFAFEPNFIEMRNIESGEGHIMPRRNIRMLHSSTYEILFAYEDESSEDVVESIGFRSNGTQL